MNISKDTCEIYKITNLINSKVYIGQTHSYTTNGEKAKEFHKSKWNNISTESASHP